MGVEPRGWDPRPGLYLRPWAVKEQVRLSGMLPPGGEEMMCCLVAQPCLCDPMDCSLPGSSVHGISQARILERVAISFNQAIFLTQGSNPRLLH